MKIQDKLYARAILLEQFKKGVDDYKKALKAVHSELGSKVMSRVSASLWYKRFQQDDFSMGAMKTVAGRVLSKNLNMLKTMRALYCSLRTEEEPHHCTTSGSNGRFQFLSYQGVHWVVDTFHGQQKQMNFDWCGIQKNKRGRSLAAQCSKILSMDYVDETTVLIVINNTKGTALLRGTFDLNNCTTKVTDFLELPRGFSHVFVPTSQQIGCVRSHWGRNNNYHTISCQNSLQLELKLQNFEALGLLTQRDGFLFGFHCDTHSNINAKSLVHVSLDDGVVTKHATKLFAGLPTVSFYSLCLDG
ncbi:hypothetical protein M3Y95_00614000 [Aphelenchoides besseyi]|nr:hypothetical protein M3Y95_00614000 [Aphelenchoides besseyi]